MSMRGGAALRSLRQFKCPLHPLFANTHLPAALATKEAQDITGPPELLAPVQRWQQCHLACRLDLAHQVAVHMLLETGTPPRLQLPRACHKLVQEAEVAEVGLAPHLHGRGAVVG